MASDFQCVLLSLVSLESSHEGCWILVLDVWFALGPEHVTNLFHCRIKTQLVSYVLDWGLFTMQVNLIT